MSKILILLILLTSQLTHAGELNITGIWYKAPMGTSLLGASIFLEESVFKKLGVSEGTPVFVSHRNKSLHLRVYKYFQKSKTFGMRKSTGKALSLSLGSNKLFIKTIEKSNWKIKARPLGIKYIQNKGNKTKWPGMILSAPHGDSDLFTANIVKGITDKIGIPSVATTGCRLTYRGQWYDCNRPLRRPPTKNNKGIASERSWDKKSQKVYDKYQDAITNVLGQKKAKFFVSLHGHDLTSKRKSLNVIEAMGVGLSHIEIKKIKRFYDLIKKRYFKRPPSIYFGNLKGDQSYIFKGSRHTFIYSALGARTYGTLRTDLVEKGLHLETPNSMRMTRAARKQTIALLSELMVYIKNEINTTNKEVGPTLSLSTDNSKPIHFDGGEFLMGATVGGLWNSEYPAHKIKLSPFSIDRHEVSTREFVAFLNINLGSGQSQNKNLNLLKNSISFVGGEFVVASGYENYPIRYISFEAASKFCHSKGGKIPTEAQWEYAASYDEVTGQKYMFGILSDDLSSIQANIETSEAFGLKVGGSYLDSSFGGGKDFSGNLWEWTSDWFSGSTYKRRVPHSLNPVGPVNGTMKSIRGGSFSNEVLATRTTMRIGIHPGYRLPNVGFRCAY